MLTPCENPIAGRNHEIIVRPLKSVAHGCDLRTVLEELSQIGARYILLDLSDPADTRGAPPPAPPEPEPCMRSEVYFG